MTTSRDDWERFDATSIPTKAERPELEEWLERIPPRGMVLDLGCGVGTVSRRLVDLGFGVVGVDINEQALGLARESVPEARFYRRDIASPQGVALDEAPFAAVVCQLVLSILGGPAERRNLLRNAFDVLSPGGHLYLSASGVSGEINPGYQKLYAEDFPRTGERYTYFSRNAEGNILYRTHHFTEEELQSLLDTAGFELVEIQRKREASSRRPEEAAYFFYAFCRNAGSF